MIFHKNRLLADDSHEISYLIFFFRKLGKVSQNLTSAAVVIDTFKGLLYYPKALMILFSSILRGTRNLSWLRVYILREKSLAIIYDGVSLRRCLKH